MSTPIVPSAESRFLPARGVGTLRPKISSADVSIVNSTPIVLEPMERCVAGRGVGISRAKISSADGVTIDRVVVGDRKLLQLTFRSLTPPHRPLGHGTIRAGGGWWDFESENFFGRWRHHRPGDSWRPKTSSADVS